MRRTHSVVTPTKNKYFLQGKTVYHGLSSLVCRASPSMTDAILETRNLSRAFGGFLAVNRVNLRVRQGTIHALIGPNGAGKTTLFNLLTKFLHPTEGQIIFAGRDITKERACKLPQSGICRSFQISATFGSLTALENVRIALQQKEGTAYYFWRSMSSVGTLNGKALELLADVGLEEFADTSAAELPYGRRRALELATTLALNPTILLLDEPMAGLGLEETGRITQLIRSVAKGRTVVLVEHNLSVVSDLSDEITVLQRGEILASGVYAEVAQRPDVIEAYMGTGDD